MADEPVMPADVAGLVARLRAMSPDDRTRACVAVNICVNNDLAKRLFAVLHGAPKAATALEAQAAELAMWREVKHSSPRLEIIEAELTAERAAHAETRKFLAAVREDAMSADNKLCSMEASVESLSAENERLRKALKEAADALDAAMEDVEHWGAYAGEYFQDKHDLDGDLSRISEQATAARRALEGGE